MDYIIGKKYRLLELNESSAHYGDKREGEVFTCIGFFAGFPDFVDKNGRNFYTHPIDGYPKMELVEEEQIKERPTMTYWGGLQHLNPVCRTFKKHYRFKNREYIKSH